MCLFVVYSILAVLVDRVHANSETAGNSHNSNNMMLTNLRQHSSRHILWANDLLQSKQGRIFIDFKHKNFTSSLIIHKQYDSIYVISNRSSLLQLRSDTLKYVDSFNLEPLSELCGKEEHCQVTQRLSTMATLLISKMPFPLICHTSSVQYLDNRVSQMKSPKSCFVPKTNLQSRPFLLMGLQLPLDEDASAPVVLSVQDYTYLAGVQQDQLHIIRTPTPQLNGRSRSGLKPLLRTPLNSGIFGKGDFIMGFETTNTVYFLLRESSKSSCEGRPAILTRVVRVCKDDPGGLAQLKGETDFGTLAKATLECQVSSPGSRTNNHRRDQWTYRYTHAVDAQWNVDLELLFVLFHGTKGGPKGSTVCAYSLRDVEAAFESPAATNGTRFPIPNICSVLSKPESRPSNSELDEVRLFSTKSSLRKASIRAWHGRPLLVMDGELWQRVLVKSAPRLTSEAHQSAVLYILSENRLRVDSYVVSIFPQVDPVTQQPPTVCPYDSIHLEVEDERVNDLHFNSISEEPYLLILTNYRVMQLALYRCSSGVLGVTDTAAGLTPTQCFSDPYCGWTQMERKCQLIRPPTPQSDIHTDTMFEKRVPPVCHGQDQPFTVETPNHILHHMWIPCRLPADTSLCLCHFREGRIQVTNCTVDGGWSDWSPWTRCSEGCGRGKRHRVRTCTNPVPQFGGRPCPLSQANREYENCDASSESCSLDHAGVDEDGWSRWSDWSDCSNPCGSGQQQKHRTCLIQGKCVGESVNTRQCHGTMCHGVVEQSNWTPWLLISRDSPHSVRMKLTCRDPTMANNKSTTLSRMLVEEKTCTNDGCSLANPGFSNLLVGRWSAWSTWSVCNRTCDGGIQTRRRVCEPKNSWCLGVAEVSRWCNVQPCERDMYWSTWSTWSLCDAPGDTCERPGLQYRTRHCTLPNYQCFGTSRQEKSCYKEGCYQVHPERKEWTIWSDWSTCDATGFQTRVRKCNLCSGSTQEYQSCPSMDVDDTGTGGTVVATQPQNSYPSVVFYLVLTGIAGFILGVVITIVIHCLCLCYRKRRHQRNAPVLMRPNTSYPKSDKMNNLSTANPHIVDDSQQSEYRYHSVDMSVEDMNIQSPTTTYQLSTYGYISRGRRKEAPEQYENPYCLQPYSPPFTSSSNPSEVDDSTAHRYRTTEESKARANTPPDRRESPPLPPRSVSGMGSVMTIGSSFSPRPAVPPVDIHTKGSSSYPHRSVVSLPH